MAYLSGKLVSKLRLPAILGWLLAGMILGPYAFNFFDEKMMNAAWYNSLLRVFEVLLGIMLGSELVISKLKKSGKQIFVTTMWQSLTAFVVVSVSFGVIFYFMDIPFYLALMFGSIALATAPAPALSIVKEFNTKGPVTDTLIPMAVLDDVVAIVVFFTLNALIASKYGGHSSSLVMTLFSMLAVPIGLGVVIGIGTGKVLNKMDNENNSLILIIAIAIITAMIGNYINTSILSEPNFNFMLAGMGYATAFCNIVTEEKLEKLLEKLNPVIMLGLMVVIVNLGAPLDYSLIVTAGLFTFIYIVARAAGKYFGAYCGAKQSKMPETVQKYLGLTLLPHSGVSLVFTGISVATLSGFDPASVVIIQSTIAAAAVINELIAVIIARKAFEWSGEIDAS